MKNKKALRHIKCARTMAKIGLGYNKFRAVYCKGQFIDITEAEYKSLATEQMYKMK